LHRALGGLSAAEVALVEAHLVRVPNTLPFSLPACSLAFLLSFSVFLFLLMPSSRRHLTPPFLMFAASPST
jgi:hypothetical protein